MRAQIWRHHREDHGGLISQALRHHGIEVVESLVGPFGTPTSDDTADFLVILGSSESVYDETLPWLSGEMDELRRRIDDGVRVLGICFGAQMLCLVHGGRVAKAPQGELGWYHISTRTPLLPTGPWFQYHNDHCEVPPTAEILGQTDLAIQAFVIGQHLGVQFHPEVDSGQLRDWFAADTDAQRSGASIAQFIEDAEMYDAELRKNADQLVRLFLGL